MAIHCDLNLSSGVAKAIEAAYGFATVSPDRSNQNGAIFFDSNGNALGIGYNQFPSGFYLQTSDFTPAEGDSEETVKAKRDLKLKHIEHAERAAIYRAGVMGGTEDGILVCPWAACFDCARAIVLSKVSKLIVHQQRMDHTPARWQAEVNAALERLSTVVEIQFFGGKIPMDEKVTVQVNGRPWSPAKLEFTE